MSQVMISAKDKSSYSELCIDEYQKLIPNVKSFDALQHTPIPALPKTPGLAPLKPTQLL